MEQIVNLLIGVDQTLEQISVKGSDTYAMVKARNMLRSAFDLVKKEEEGEKENVSTAE